MPSRRLPEGRVACSRGPTTDEAWVGPALLTQVLRRARECASLPTRLPDDPPRLLDEVHLHLETHRNPLVPEAELPDDGAAVEIADLQLVLTEERASGEALDLGRREDHLLESRRAGVVGAANLLEEQLRELRPERVLEQVQRQAGGRDEKPVVVPER